MVVYTGRVGQITISGTAQTDIAAEATIVVGKEKGKFNPVGTAVPLITTGMNVVSGTIRKRWASGDTLLQDLLDNNTAFETVLTINVAGAETSITASGCELETVTRRIAPGTEVMIEEAPFVARHWY